MVTRLVIGFRMLAPDRVEGPVDAGRLSVTRSVTDAPGSSRWFAVRRARTVRAERRVWEWPIRPEVPPVVWSGAATHHPGTCVPGAGMHRAAVVRVPFERVPNSRRAAFHAVRRSRRRGRR